MMIISPSRLFYFSPDKRFYLLRLSQTKLQCFTQNTLYAIYMIYVVTPTNQSINHRLCEQVQ